LRNLGTIRSGARQRRRLAARIAEHVAHAVAERGDIDWRARKALRTAFRSAPTEHAEEINHSRFDQPLEIIRAQVAACSIHWEQHGGLDVHCPAERQAFHID
jgi:hypothetical protein